MACPCWGGFDSAGAYCGGEGVLCRRSPARASPWDALVATLRPEIPITIVSTVGTIMGSGFIVSRWVNLYPIESAIVNACHSGQGGTGDVAILTAGNRMELMPFAQIATRIGGAVTVTIAISAFAWFI